MSKLVTVYGGSGFVGRYIAHRMARAGWRVKVAGRRPNEALFVRTYGVVGQVEPVLCNIRDDASVALAMDGADAVATAWAPSTKVARTTLTRCSIRAPSVLPGSPRRKALPRSSISRPSAPM